MNQKDLLTVAAVGLGVFLVLRYLVPGRQFSTLSGLNVIQGSQQDRMLAEQWGA